MDFHGLKRKDLQALCKKNKIKANMTNVAMADALQALPTVEDANGILTSLLKLKHLPKPKLTYEETLIEGIPHVQIPDTPVEATEIRTYTRQSRTKKKTASDSEPLDRVGFDPREDVVSLDSSVTSLGGGGMDGGDGVAEVESPPLDVVVEDRTAENHPSDKFEDWTVENEKHYGESPPMEEDRTVGDEQGKMDGGDVATLEEMMKHKDEKYRTVDINYENEANGLDVLRPENMDRAVENEQQSGEVESPPMEEDPTVDDERGKIDGQDVSRVEEMDQKEVENEMNGEDISTFENVDRTANTEKVRNMNQTPEYEMDGVDVASTENVDRTVENDSSPILGLVEEPKKSTTVDSEDVHDRTAAKERKITGRETDFAGEKSSDLFTGREPDFAREKGPDLFTGEEKEAENDASEKLVDVPVVLECEGLDSIEIPIPLPVEAKDLGETWGEVVTPAESVGEEAKIPEEESSVGVNLTVESPEKESLSLGEENLIPEESMILSISSSSSSLNICTEGNVRISPEEMSDGGEFGLEEPKTDKNVEFEDLSLRQLRILCKKMSTSANATDSKANKDSDVSVPNTTEAVTAVNEKVDTINTSYGESIPNQLRKSISIKGCSNLASDKATTATSACKEIHIDGENSGYGDIRLRKLKSSCKSKMPKELVDEMGILDTGSAAAKVVFTVQGHATPTSIVVANSCRSSKVVRGNNNVHGSKGGKSISKLASDKATTASPCKFNEINREKSGHQNMSLSKLKSLYKSKMPTETVDKMGNLDICSRITQAATATPISKALVSNNKAFGSKSKGFSNLASNKATAPIHKSNTTNGENSACRSMRHRKLKSSYKSEVSKKMINKTSNLDILSPSSAAAKINLPMQEQATTTNNKVNSSHRSCCENSCQGDMSLRKLRSSLTSKVSNETVEKAGNLDILSPRSKVAKLKLSVQDQATPTSNKVDSSCGGSCENSHQGDMSLRRLRSSYKSKMLNGTIEKTGHLDILSPSSVAAKLMLVQNQATPNRSKIGSSYCSNKVLVSNNSVHGSKSKVGSRSKGKRSSLGILDENCLKNPGKP